MDSDYAVDAAEAEHVANEAMAIVADGEAAWPSMTYEQGVRDTLQWLLGEADENPLAEHPAYRPR